MSNPLISEQPFPAGGGAQETPQIACPACGTIVKQVASATLDLALWQHWNWVCSRRPALPPERAALVERLERLRMRVEGERRTMLSSPMGLSQLYSAIEKGLREAVSVLKGE